MVILLLCAAVPCYAESLFPIEVSQENLSSFLVSDAKSGILCFVKDGAKNLFGQLNKPRVLEPGAQFKKLNPNNKKHAWLQCVEDGVSNCSKMKKTWKKQRKLKKECLSFSVTDLPEPNEPPCSYLTNSESTELETEISAALSQNISEVDFTYSIERADGRRFTFNKGGSTLQKSYESASTSKLISAVIILTLVDQGHLSLSDRPQDHISSWPIPSADPLFNITLDNLLSFTSGLVNEPLCLNLPGADFENCIIQTALQNAFNQEQPGQNFFYASTHLQVAGLMAVKAAGYESWQDLFNGFKEQSGLFKNSHYDLPSSLNPRLAGGMHWTGEDYLEFLQALKQGELLSPFLQAEMLSNQAAAAQISYSPVMVALGQDWRYGYGLWNECNSPVYNCESGARVSSPGAYGAYPFWDTAISLIGILARQGALGTFENGYEIDLSVRPIVESWARCS